MGGSPGDAFSPCADDLIVSEINYHSADLQNAGDWFEIKNQLNVPVDLSGWTIRDENDLHVFTIPDGKVIAAGGYFVVCENDADFSALHAGVLDRVGDLGFGLSNGGDVIRLYDSSGALQLSICYDDEAPWNTTADGEGYTLELVDAYVNLNDPLNWFAGCIGGSPGGPYDPLCVPVAVEPVDSANFMHLFPNPVSDELSIHFEHELKGKLSVLDLLGKIVLEKTITSQNEVLRVDELNAGVYFLQVNNRDRLIIQKFSKE
jgi:hypothetical protein